MSKKGNERSVREPMRAKDWAIYFVEHLLRRMDDRA